MEYYLRALKTIISSIQGRYVTGTQWPDWAVDGTQDLAGMKGDWSRYRGHLGWTKKGTWPGGRKAGEKPGLACWVEQLTQQTSEWPLCERMDKKIWPTPPQGAHRPSSIDRHRPSDTEKEPSTMGKQILWALPRRAEERAIEDCWGIKQDFPRES